MSKHPYTNVIAAHPRFTVWADLVHSRFDHLPIRHIFKSLTAVVPTLLLPWQADEKRLTGVNGWNLAVTDHQKRELIKGAVELHAYKGTAWSIREIIRRLGYGEIILDTHLNSINYDGKAIHNGHYFYGDKYRWSLYRVTLNVTITNEEARFIREVLRYFAPAHCSLLSLDYSQASLFYDGEANYDANYNHGEA